MKRIKTILLENPDLMRYNGTMYEWSDDDAYSFGYINGQVYVNPFSHADVAGDRKKFKYAGRVWTDDGVMSFWEYPPNKQEMKRLVEQIQQYFDIRELNVGDIWNTYKVEIFIKSNEFMGNINVSDEFDNSKIYPDDPDKGGIAEKRVIQVKDFVGSENADNSDKQHIKSPMIKTKSKDIHGFGSDKRPNNMTQTQRHQMKSTSEEKESNISDALHEKIYSNINSIINQITEWEEKNAKICNK